MHIGISLSTWRGHLWLRHFGILTRNVSTATYISVTKRTPTARMLGSLLAPTTRPLLRENSEERRREGKQLCESRAVEVSRHQQHLQSSRQYETVCTETPRREERCNNWQCLFVRLLFVCFFVTGLYNLQWNVMATFSNDYHFRREEVTVFFQCYNLGEPPASRLVNGST
jgi:hypothetical protein